MAKKYTNPRTQIQISPWAKEELLKIGAKSQPMHAIMDDLLANYPKLMEEVMKYKQTSIPEDLHKRLEARQRPHQAIAGVIEELLNLAERVEKAQTPTIPYLNLSGEATKSSDG